MTRLASKIIGGMFGLDARFQPAPAPPPFIEPGSLLLANARSGIRVLIEQLKPARVWMPSYLCAAMLDGAGDAPVHFYAVGADLSVPDLNGIAERDLVIIVDYFGFPAPVSLIQHAKSRGAWVLEDACQALLTGGVGRLSDFVLFSPRKFVGTPDGGILTSHSDFKLDQLRLEDPPASWALKAFEAVVLRREFDLYGGDRRWFTVFQELERECPVGRFRMSDVSQMLLLHTFDYAAIAQARRENYARLAGRLGGIALFPSVPPHVAPLGFPVRVEARDRVREALFAACIYPPVHWPISDIVPDRFTDSRRLSREILTLPCDQRYTPEDMDRMAAIVLETLASER
ncbi:MAG TPA: DegT/DnrJ/EryC1/StrS family aminotransferase [Candidatus Acidoferrum sp.]|jgi:dTDP-4-amino-4,6-dideoxygalactose transaminase|nr:DegT/DnrJ/EryC1/StrS family aminotransferase [Candidatus Acidoferrum sp.]